MRSYSVDFSNYRNHLLKAKKYKFNKGDKRFKDVIFCSACGNILVNWDKDTKAYVATHSFFKTELFGRTKYICASGKLCHKHRLDTKGEEPVNIVLTDDYANKTNI